ncbi:hypothetical protein DEU56DRAFT_754739 [Suillus clintonianus]|uniref:uncharacterized protein n=1 Tax=Suillus clintonianus TaxID=1904413 RepID=UPI001B884293|nr:uncharacterized protein DEU56DRAFT_754739 [Suillus clintonianus]KAG2142402.1 hypothetical protein DEU56DRAFT_754739 [Suillus clintonianus]
MACIFLIFMSSSTDVPACHAPKPIVFEMQDDGEYTTATAKFNQYDTTTDTHKVTRHREQKPGRYIVAAVIGDRQKPGALKNPSITVVKLWIKHRESKHGAQNGVIDFRTVLVWRSFGHRNHWPARRLGRLFVVMRPVLGRVRDTGTFFRRSQSSTVPFTFTTDINPESFHTAQPDRSGTNEPLKQPLLQVLQLRGRLPLVGNVFGTTLRSHGSDHVGHTCPSGPSPPWSVWQNCEMRNARARYALLCPVMASHLLTGGMNDRGVCALGLATFRDTAAKKMIGYLSQSLFGCGLRGIAKREEKKTHIRYRVTIRAPEKEGGNPH